MKKRIYSHGLVSVFIFVIIFGGVAGRELNKAVMTVVFNTGSQGYLCIILFFLSRNEPMNSNILFGIFNRTCRQHIHTSMKTFLFRNPKSSKPFGCLFKDKNSCNHLDCGNIFPLVSSPLMQPKKE